MKIGWGKREFSLDVPCNISGQTHMRVSRGILDPLYITALAIQGEDLVVFVSIDTAAIAPVFQDVMVEKIQAIHPEIQKESLIMNATHSHTSMQNGDGCEVTPDGFKVFPAEKTREHAGNMAAEAVDEAIRNLKEGAFAYGYGYAVVGHSRRVLYDEDMSVLRPSSLAPNGHAVMYGNTNDPHFSGYEAGADHFINFMYTFDEKENLTGIVVNVPCPSQTSEVYDMLSADYWTEVREYVQREFGENVYVLPQCAAAGDTSPRILHYKDAQRRRMDLKYDAKYTNVPWREDPHNNFVKFMAERKDIADRIVTAAKEVYSWAKKEIIHDAPVRHICETVPVHKRLVTDEEAERCREDIERMKANPPSHEGISDEEYNRRLSTRESIIRRNERAIARNKECNAEKMLNVTLHAVEIGDIAFVTERFELYIDFMHRVQARSPFIQTFVVQLAGEPGASYLATERGQKNRGYSASIFCNAVSAEGGQDIVEAWLRMLNELKEGAR